MTTPPKVSLCVLTYNRASVLPRSLDCLLAQTYQDFEIVINDDNSSDDTTRVALEYAARDPRIRYFRNERNVRYAGNQNAAIERARSEYMAFIHDGDLYREDMVEKWLGALKRHPSAAFVFNAHGVLDGDGKRVRVQRHPFGELISGRCLFDYCLSQPSLPVWGILMVRKSCLLAAGPFDTEFPVIADVDMWLRLMLYHDCVYIPEPLVWLAPREKGHQNARINWRIATEFERIYWRNLRRRLELQPDLGRFLEPEVSALLRVRWLTQFASAVSHLRIVSALQGILHMAGFQKRKRLEFGK